MSIDVLVPLKIGATALTTATAPTAGQITRYDASGGALAPPLPALSGLNVGATFGVKKDETDASANAVTVTCAGSDTLVSGATTAVLTVKGSLKVLQVVLVSAAKKWAIVSADDPLSSLDLRFAPFGGGGGGSSLVPQTVQTASFAATVGKFWPIDTTSATTVVAAVATAPADGAQVELKVVAGPTANGQLTHPVTVNLGGSDVVNIAGGANTFQIKELNQGVTLQYKASTSIWYVVSDDLSLAQLDSRYVGIANAAPLSNATPQPLGTASPGTGTNSSRDDHVHQSVAVPGIGWAFGDGSDGDLVFDGTSTVTGFGRTGTSYSRVGAASIYANNVTISAGVTVNTGCCLMYVAGTLTIAATGTLTDGQANGAGATGGSVGFLGTPQIGAGGNGGNGGTTTGSAGSGAQASGQSYGAGGAGGLGTTGNTGGAGGAGGFNNSNSRHNALRAPQTVTSGATVWLLGGVLLGGGSGGGGGGGDGTNAGGGGGAGGNNVVVICRNLVNNGLITARGGNGAAGVAGNAGGGGGGSGGFCYVTTLAASGSGTVSAAGGTGGAGAGTGAAGAAGSAGFALLTVFAG